MPELPTPDRVRRIAVVDDDTVIRLGTPLLLERTETIGVYANIEELLADRPAVDVVLLDLNLAGVRTAGVLHGAEGIASVTRAGYRVLVYTNERRRMVLAGCLAAGARGVAHKSESMAAVRAAVRVVAEDGQVITPAIAGLAELVGRHGDLPTLTARQREVLALRARGESYTRIGRRLAISTEEHMRDVSRKFTDYLRTHSATDLERHLGLDSAEHY